MHSLGYPQMGTLEIDLFRRLVFVETKLESEFVF